jgi:hypothetical protein
MSDVEVVRHGRRYPRPGIKRAAGRFLQTHPEFRAMMVAIAGGLVVSLIAALIYALVGQQFSPYPPPGPPFVTPSVLSTTSPTPVPYPQPPVYSPLDCLTGNFSRSAPKDVQRVSCSSRSAKLQVIERFEGTTDMGLCDDVHGVRYAFSEEYTRNGVPESWTGHVYCLGEIGSR